MVKCQENHLISFETKRSCANQPICNAASRDSGQSWARCSSILNAYTGRVGFSNSNCKPAQRARAPNLASVYNMYVQTSAPNTAALYTCVYIYIVQYARADAWYTHVCVCISPERERERKSWPSSKLSHSPRIDTHRPAVYISANELP